MTSQYRHRRTSSPSTAFPNPLEPGEIAVNTANRQIAIGDAQSGVVGQPLPAIAVRYFDTRAQYVVNDFVQNGTSIYRAKGPISPGAFNIANWDMMVGTVDPQYVLKAGDTMTGMLSLPATTPTIGTHATNKTYVDAQVATKSTIYSATSPPPGALANSMWFETDTGLLYVLYNDGSTSQWVIACPQPDISNFVLRSGDNMSGPLGVPVTPTLPAHATSKSYVDAQLAGKSSIIAADTPPVGAIDNSLWYETDSGATYVRYNDLNGGAQWVAIADPAGTAYAAPFDALAYSGMQVNGSFDVSQEKGFSTPVTANYFCDSWSFYAAGSMSTNCGVYPTSAFPGLTNCAVVVVATAQASMGAADYCLLQTAIEGYRNARLAWGLGSPQPITLGFWTMHSKPGTYSVVVCNAANDRAYGTTYTQNVANTPEYKTITIPPPTDGTWLTTNARGLIIQFAVACGANYTLPAANVWTARVTSSFAVPGQVNGVDSTANVFRIAGLVVLPGIEAPRADRSALIMRPYDQELVTCQRYYEKSYDYAIRPGTANNLSGCVYWIGGVTAVGESLSLNGIYRTRKRAAPTVTWYSPGTGAAGMLNIPLPVADTACTVLASGETACTVYASPPAGTSQIQGHWTADARL